MDARVCGTLLSLMLLLPHLSLAWTPRGECDRMETHRIGGAAGTPTQSVVFVWNSGNAEIKRLDTRGLLDVPVEDVDIHMRPPSPQGPSAKVAPPTDEDLGRRRTLSVLENTVLPSVDFRASSVSAVLNVLQGACDRNPPEIQRIRFALQEYSTGFQPPNPVPSDGPAAKDEQTPGINLQAENLSVYAVLDFIRDCTGFMSLIRTNGSVVVRWCGDDEPVYEIYWLDRSAYAALARLLLGETPSSVISRKEVSDRFKQHIAALSGRLDDLRQVNLLDRIEALVVCATPALHKQIEAFLRVISDGERAPGTYRMHAALDADGGQTVLLFDAEEGHVWQYRAGHKDEEGNRCGERFALVPEN